MPRIAQCNYCIDANSNTVIEKGTKVFIPVHAIHHDSEYYPDPDKFEPARFEKEEMGKRDKMTWLGFGGGRRNWYVGMYRSLYLSILHFFLFQYRATIWTDANSSRTDYDITKLQILPRI